MTSKSKKKYYEARLGLKPMIILNDIGIKAKFKLLTWIFTYVRVKIHVFRLIKTMNIVMFLQFPVAMNIYTILSLIWIVLNIFSIICMLYNFDTPSYINFYRLITTCKSDVLEYRDKDMFPDLDNIKFF